jgi:hypothetical protein
MRCRQASKLLALYAGGDLPERETARLLAHLESCRECRSALENHQATLAVLGRIAAADTPEPLPADFTQRILLQTMAEKNEPRSSLSALTRLLSWKPALALGAAAVAVFLAWGPAHEMIRARTGFSGLMRKSAAPSRTLKPGEILWGAQIQLIGKIQGPFRLGQAEPPDTPGIYAVLHRPDPVNRPNVFAVDYIGQSQRLSAYAGYLAEQKNTLLSRAGSLDSLFVVFYPMPESTDRERQELANNLAARFDSFIKDNGGV